MPLDRLLPMYRDYDVFVLPTLPGEGIPRVLLEAMTAGLPIVTTRVAGIPSLVTHEVNGWLVEQPTVDAVVGRDCAHHQRRAAAPAAHRQRLRDRTRLHARRTGGAADVRSGGTSARHAETTGDCAGSLSRMAHE